ncbi:hypothetical protein C447_05093 [Halococcus hamelinensis 100A6]|uniref:Uncharacterized protein n=1 Tax=Halococcus hamelinensis 100A6 TaxID=1132509 RepID=M0M6A1_9EURY|nr:hypothetical protein C447_05093 [Halococcus hamelinensis 100A6]
MDSHRSSIELRARSLCSLPRNAERLARLVFRASRSLAPLVHAKHRRFASLTTCFTLAPLA